MSAATPPEQILGIVNNHWQSCCVGAAAQLELADLLADGPLHVDILAERTKTHGPSLYRMLRALESTGIFTQTSPRVFGNTPTSECLRRNRAGSNWAWIRFTLCSGAPVFEGWRGLMLSLKNGRPGFHQVTGENAWVHLQSNPQTYTIFNEAMRDLSASISPTVATSFDWGRFPVIADIGGGIGSQLTSILDAHPSCRGILFDQPAVVAEAPDHRRIERVGGDFFKEVPAQADAYVMRWILHDWSDEESVGVLTNVRKVANPNARLMVVESVILETPEFDMGKWMDLNMMVMATGRERTIAEFRDLLDQAGFALEQIVPTRSPLSIVVGKPMA
jgi:O-methyltransferase domain